MADEIYIPKGGAFGWLVSVVRNTDQQLPVRYYVGLSDRNAALYALRRTLKLRDTAQVSFRDCLTKHDILALNLRLGEIRKA